MGFSKLPHFFQITKRPKGHWSAIVAYLVCLLILLGACNMSQHGMALSQRDPKQEQLREKLEALLRNSQLGDIISIANYVDVKWDRMCVFYEATSYENINEVIGFKWISEDGYLFNNQYLVFLDGNVVTMHFPLAVSHFFIKNAAGGRCMSRDEAVFKVEGVKLATGNGIRKYFAFQE